MNFMSIEQAKLEFNEKNIISICGLNDSGKSAITRALSIILYDNYSRDQVRFIKEGATSFKIQLNFDDGVSISKTKYDNGTSIWLFTQGDKVLYTNQLKTSVQAVSDVPDPIKQYLGVIYDDCTDSLINVRRNTDKLFLIETTGGDNYKLFNTILKSEVLAKASMSMTADKNKLNADVQAKTNVYNTYVQQYESLDVAPEEEQAKLRQYTKQLSETNIRNMELERLLADKEMVDNMAIQEECIPVDLTRLGELHTLISDYEASVQAVAPELVSADTDRLKAILALISENEKVTTGIPPETTVVSLDRLQDLLRIGDALLAYQDAQTALNNVSAEHEQVLGQLKALSEQYNFKICKNCGTVVT